MKSNKAVGVNNIPAEFWKVLREKALKELTELCKAMTFHRAIYLSV